MKPLFSRNKPGDRGVALLLVLTIIAILTGVAIESHRQLRGVVMASAVARDQGQLSWTAASGVQVAMALLIKDKNTTKTDSMQEEWADQEVISELLAELPHTEGSLKVTISDCLGKIQVNALVKQPHGQKFNPGQKALWDRFLRPVVTAHEMEEVNATADIINSMKDWMDAEDDDAITGINGAETDYYEGLDPPYRARNGFLRKPDELMLIKGFTRELYNGTEEIPAVGPFVTVYGGEKAERKNTVEFAGKINISTATYPVIRALLPSESEDLAQSIIDYREEKEEDVYLHQVTSLNWYKKAPGCSELKINSGLITVSSDYFRIESTAGKNGISQTVTAVVHREKDPETKKWTCRILSWEKS